jgi:hypothetical protein
VSVDDQVRIEKAIYAHAADYGDFAIAYALIQVAAALNAIADDERVHETLRDIAASIGELKGSSK